LLGVDMSTTIEYIQQIQAKTLHFSMLFKLMMITLARKSFLG